MFTSCKRETHEQSAPVLLMKFVRSQLELDRRRKEERRSHRIDEYLFVRSFFVFVDESANDAASLFRFSPFRPRQNERGKRKIGRRANERKRFIVRSLYHVRSFVRSCSSSSTTCLCSRFLVQGEKKVCACRMMSLK